MRLFNEFTAGSDLLRIWPRTTTPNSIAAFSMIHLLYDRVDRDSALINDPLPSRYSSSPTISIADSRGGARSGGKRRGEWGGEGRKIRIFRGTARTYVSVLSLSGGRWGGSRFMGGSFRFRPPPPPRLRGIGGSFRRWDDIATTEFDRSLVRSDDQRIRHDACGKRG